MYLIFAIFITGVSAVYNDTAQGNFTDCGPVARNLTEGVIELMEPNKTTVGAIATIRCNDGFEAVPLIIICSTSGEWSDASCEPIDCGDPQNVEHGSVVLKDNLDTSFGAEATLICEQGYNASSATFICDETGYWETVMCVSIGCGDVPQIEDGRIVLIDNATFGSQANVTCDLGFTADKSRITCLSSGYWDDNVTCTQTNCGNPPDIEYGSVILTDTSNTSFAAEAVLTCDPGYNASLTILRCDEDGNWENATCSLKDCGPVRNDLTNGEVVLMNPNTNTSVGAMATVRCDEGYDPVPLTINCTVSGEWEEASCDPIDCGNSPDIEYGSVTLNDSTNTSLAAEAVLSCNPGYNASLKILRCGEDGNWENATCRLAGCGAVPEIEDGNIVFIDNATFGSQANVTCDPGFTADKSNITCLSSGYWDDNVTCIRTGCGDLPEIENGTIFLTDNPTFGSQATVTCDNGFTADKSYITCLSSGNWDDNVTCTETDCGDVPEIDHGNIVQISNSKFGSLANVTCDSGYTAEQSNITCLTSGNWDNATCIKTGCGHVPEISDGFIVLTDQSTFGSEATVTCSPGFTSDKSNITCLTSGRWENATCSQTDCSVNAVPSVANGEVILDTDGNQSTASVANVSCYNDYAATSPVIACLGQGQWQEDVLCVAYDLGTVRVETGQEIRDGQYIAYFRCAFSIVDGLKYKMKWYVNELEFHDTGVITSTQASLAVLTDEMISDSISANGLFSQFFNLQVKCTAAVYDGAGETELESDTSTEITPLHVSTNSITMIRGKEATFTVFLNFPFGCSTDSQDCFLRFIVYDPSESHWCCDSTIAIIHSDTCGGKVEGATPATISQLSTTNIFTNITITTKNNRWYRLRSQFSLLLMLVAVGNSKTMWNSQSTSVSVTVTENYLTRYRGCYSFVDPYIYTFDRRWYSNQLLEEFVLFRHKTLPIEVQTITAPCNRWATCSCAVTVRAGGDVFTINHCSGHLTTFLSSNDGILKVYRLWSTYYKIILPTGMNVYVYVMSYMNYMMNVYVTPTPSDFEQMEGLCGNFNGDFSDDTILRGTNQSDPVESTRNGYRWWWWWSDYFFPHTFAYSWGLVLTGRQDESLLNPDVYENVESWDSNKKLCVCPYANTGNDYTAICSADEEATCTRPVWRWGTRIEAQTRNKRDVDSSRKFSKHFDPNVKKRLQKMRKKWETLREMHTALRKKREVNNSTTIPIEDAKKMCTEQLNRNCNTYSKKDDVSDVAESNDTLENCARDTAISGTTEWVTPHCDAITQKVTVEIEKDVEFAENNSDLVDNIVENSCPSNCSGHGQCVNQTCVCIQDFGTDLCLLNLTLGPLIEELADEGICDVSTGNECDYILIVGNGFVETAKCNLTVYVAGTDGIFNLTEEFEINCTYTTFNELFAEVPELTNSSDNTNATLIARMFGISVSNDGINFGSQETVVVLDTTCQQRQWNADNETIVTLKAGYCYIAGTCYTAGSYLNGSTCAKCDTSKNIFVWTDGCNNEDDTNKNYLIIIGGCVGGAILVATVALGVYIYKHMKGKAARTVVPLVESSLGPSKMKFWYRKDSNVGIVKHHLPMKQEKKPSAAEYYSDDEEFPHSVKDMKSDW